MPATPPTSPRFGAPRYLTGDVSDFGPQVNGITDALDLAARIDTGLASARPPSSVANGFYYATDTRQLSRWNGIAWENVAPSAHAASHAAGAADALTVTETMMATGATGPAKGAFNAWRNAAVSLPTANVVVFDTDTGTGFDVSNWYDTATGRYTPQIAGYYDLSFSVRANVPLAADQFWVASLRKNGVAICVGQIAYQRGTLEPNTVGSTVMNANGSTDYFDVIIEHNVGAAVAIKAELRSTSFQAHLIGRS